MPSALIRALAERHRLPVVDERTIDACLAPAAGEPPAALVLFTGDPARWPEADDAAVILPELIRAFPGQLRGAVVARAAEEGLKSRFGVAVFPSIALVRGGETLVTIAKVRDWAEYCARIRAALADGAEPARRSQGPKPSIRLVGGSDA
ncbi:hydrogenase-1 operon protein HyaE [Roseiarcus fermentans]|uniref:Hydrogenase expression/formation protein n=1 Tax=Roseiarcus fermentans TaxID=1473586 RepID=A0A366FAV0_9HYPH|nr:hydrogenase accessory protein [Roseiarcus fermentans]RBP11226.1 hydrogenase-1 operon protein HyaE [Roseiarcus fermentans]